LLIVGLTTGNLSNTPNNSNKNQDAQQLQIPAREDNLYAIEGDDFKILMPRTMVL
jgi:hypothetical protein